MKLKIEKMSKSSGAPVYTKAQVFKAGSNWLYACQEGCANKFVPGASQALMFKIAESHMTKAHKDGTFRRSLINGR